jgi:hypothetical protein
MATHGSSCRSFTPRRARAETGTRRRTLRASAMSHSQSTTSTPLASVRARGGELVGKVENYEDMYRLCYVRGPEGIIVELAERMSG